MVLSQQNASNDYPHWNLIDYFQAIIINIGN